MKTTPPSQGHGVQRVSALDMSNLRVEERGLPMHISVLALLDGRPLLDAGGELLTESIRRHVARRIRDVERLHQVLVWSHGRHRPPSWQAAPGFDVSDHVATRKVPPPGDEEALLRLCCDLNAAPLDRSRPLWELWLLDGLPGDGVAILLRLHHVVGDGTAALDLFSAMFDPEPAMPPPFPGEPSPAGGDAHAPSRPLGIGRIVEAAATGTAQGWALVRLGRAPALSWNRPVGPRRVQLLVRGDLARAKAAAHAHGGKVNDVVLAAVSGGAYRWLESRGELVPGRDMHVSVAASVRRAGETGGNRVGVRLLAVPVSDPDAVSRLDTIATRTARQRHRPPLQPNGRIQQRWTVHAMSRQRLVNMVLSNMPGPPVPLRFAGARVRELFQLSALQGNCALGVGALSYAGQLTLDVAADPDIVSDVGVFAAGVTEALEQLGAGQPTTSA